ncbi:hypothetical protein VPLG_00046 [Vibrio phage eugene 12A10]|uniref:hypothetical protein n=1 Tax=Vibrio phage eugene 12A10 TaxID=573172 RepID=UPI0003515628|nr:hypothetical protein VPLG_00046 [Vibrio phage eugene 12A10]AGN51485.1 hypothetical protein VPLG_00046 [Vibrio phage eugene 12A10]
MEYNLDDYQEVTDLNVRGNKPHLAVTCKAQGFSANNRPDALLFKATIDENNTELMKTLGKVMSDVELKKASFDNTRAALEESLLEVLKISSGCEYVWVYVQDFNENLVVFSYDDKIWAVTYYEGSDGNIVLGKASENEEDVQDVVEVKRRTMYVDSDSGEELIKAADWLKPTIKVDPAADTNDHAETAASKEPQDKEKMMTDKVTVGDLDLEELTKSAAVQELIKAAVAEAEANKVAELEEAQLVTDTTELVKGFAGVEEDQVEVLVKALTSVDKEFGAALFKAFDGMQESLVAKDAELEEIKKSFGEKQDSIEGETTTKVTTAGTEGKQRTNDLAALVKARKAEQSK